MHEVTRLPRLPARNADAHKGDFGRVLIVGGSPGMTGAPCLAALAAQRSGAGLVTVALPDSLNFVAEIRLASAMSLPLPETEPHVLGDEAADSILNVAHNYDAFVIGPGVGIAVPTARCMRRLVAELPGTAVVDADALNALSADRCALDTVRALRILTPHPGEAARLLDMNGPGAVQADRHAAARKLVSGRRTIVVLKGSGTIVTDGEAEFVNPTGNPGMATGGAGDVLSGVIAGLLCQGLSPFEAAQLGVYVHGLAGDIAAGQVGELSLMAEDILDSLNLAYSELQPEDDRNGT